METLSDPFLGRVLVAILFAVIAAVAYFSLGIFLFLTKRSFGNVNINVVIFTRHDHNSKRDEIRFKSQDSNVPLRDILRNRYLFWYVIWRGLHTKLESPVLNFYSHEHAVLSPIRGRAARQSASMEYKRLAGAPYTETAYQLCMVYDRSENKRDKKTRILRVMLVLQRDLDDFVQYLRKPPRKSRNFALMEKIHMAWVNGSGSFIDVDITTA